MDLEINTIPSPWVIGGGEDCVLTRVEHCQLYIIQTIDFFTTFV